MLVVKQIRLQVTLDPWVGKVFNSYSDVCGFPGMSARLLAIIITT